MCYYDFHQFVLHNTGLRLHFSFFLALPGKVGQDRQHVNSSRGLEKNNLMDCFGTSSQLHCYIHPHTCMQGATAFAAAALFLQAVCSRGAGTFPFTLAAETKRQESVLPYIGNLHNVLLFNSSY